MDDEDKKTTSHLRLVWPPEPRDAIHLDLNAKTLLNLAEAADRGHLAGILIRAMCDTWTIFDEEREGWAGPRLGHVEFKPNWDGGMEVTIKFRYGHPEDIDDLMGTEDEPMADTVERLAYAFETWGESGPLPDNPDTLTAFMDRYSEHDVDTIVSVIRDRYPFVCPRAIRLAVEQGDQDVDPLAEPLAPCEECDCGWQPPG